MAAKLGEAVLVVKGDWTGLQDETDKQVRGPLTSTFGGGIGKMAAIAGGALAGAAIADQLKSAVSAASDLNEAVNVTGLVFGDAAAGMDTFFAGAAENLGMAESVARQTASNVGALLGNLGFGAQDAADATQTLLTRAADLGSAFNAEPEEVVTALGAALRGETEPARRFGIMLDKASVQAKAVEMGLADSTSEVDKNAEAQAALALIMEQSNKVAGDFANTADGQANSARIVSAQWKDFQAQLGQALLPVINAVLGAFKRLLPVLESFATWLADNKEVVLAIGVGIAAVVVPAFIAWAASAAAAAVATLAAAAPFIAIGAAVAALAFLIIKNWDTIKSVTVAVWEAVTGAISKAFDFIKQWAPVVARILLAVWTGGMSELVIVIVRNWDKITGFFRELPGKVMGFLTSLPEQLRSLGSRMMNMLRSGLVSAAVAVWNWVRDLPKRIVGYVGDLGKTLWNAGKDLIKGFLGGIKSMAGDLVDTAKDVALAPVNAVKGILGIGSPSKVFFGIGADTMRGFALGLERNAELPQQALTAAMPSLDTTFATSGALAPMQPVDARVVVHGSVIGLEELDTYVDRRDRRLAAALGARR
jgi:hypothetical protein